MSKFPKFQIFNSSQSISTTKTIGYRIITIGQQIVSVQSVNQCTVVSVNVQSVSKLAIGVKSIDYFWLHGNWKRIRYLSVCCHVLSSFSKFSPIILLAHSILCCCYTWISISNLFTVYLTLEFYDCFYILKGLQKSEKHPSMYSHKAISHISLGKKQFGGRKTITSIHI